MCLPQKIKRNIALNSVCTMKLGGPATFFSEVESKSDLVEAVHFAKHKNLPLFILGGGSNVVFSDEGYHGVIAQMKASNATHHLIASGKIWVKGTTNFDAFVNWCVENGWVGLTCLSGIPGTIGAAPVQNIGAYGYEIGPYIHEVEVFDTKTMEFKTIKGQNCEFAYRSSLFQKNGHLIIWGVTFDLKKGASEELRHDQLILEFGTSPVACLPLREKILSVREEKGMLEHSFNSCGSFFKNPIITEGHLLRLQKLFGEIPFYPHGPGSIKVPAAFLIEKAGFKKGKMKNGIGLSPMHALAIVQDGTGTTKALTQFARSIVLEVENLFDIELEPEPLILDASGQTILLSS